MNAAEKNKRTKKADLIVIDDDDSASAPAAVKVEGGIQTGGEHVPPPPPSPKETELREQVAKLERMFQRACRAAREAELRAEQAETLLDSKRGVLESLEKQDGGTKEKMAEMVAQLEEANRRVETADNRELELTRERDALKEEVEVMKRNTLSMRETNFQLSERITTLTHQLEHEREVSKEVLEDYRARNDELSKKFIESERVTKLNDIAPKSDRHAEKGARKEGGRESESPARKVRNQLEIITLSPSPEKIARMEETTEGAQSLPQLPQTIVPLALAGGSTETPKTLQCELKRLQKWIVIRESFAIDAYRKAKIPPTALFRSGDDGAPRTLATLMKWNGSERPFADFDEPENRKATRKRPHEEMEVVGQKDATLDKDKEHRLWNETKRKISRQMWSKDRPSAFHTSACILGILLGRTEPPHKGDEHASNTSVHILMGLANDLQGLEADRLNKIMNISEFECICGAKIADGDALLNHFNATDHTKVRSQPVYQSDVDYWIDTIVDAMDWPIRGSP